MKVKMHETTRRSSQWRRGGIAVLVFIALFVQSNPFIHAQNRTLGELRGTITDSMQARIPGATVDILNQDTGVHTIVTANADGVYDAPSLVQGAYTVTVTTAGFKAFVEHDVLLRAESLTENATLDVGAATEQVTVQATSARVEIETGEIRTDLDTKMAAELPSVGGYEGNFLQIIPGIMPYGSGYGIAAGVGSRSGLEPAINGEQSGFEQSTVDGGTRTSSTNGQLGALSQVPSEAIASENFVTANFGAEYGNGLSIFNATTKSGTNIWHGSLFEMAQNDFINAHNWFAHDQPLAPLRWNNYGGTVGGPIKKDKAFFFFTFQRNPIRNHQRSAYTLPVPSMLRGDFSQIPAKVDSAGNPVGTDPLPVFLPSSLVAAGVDPTTGATIYTRTQLPGNKMTPDQISPIAKAILAVVPAPNYLNGNAQVGQSPQACAATEGLLPDYCLINNYFSNTSYIETWTTYLGKVDYDITKQNRLDSSFMLTTDNSTGHNYPVAPQAGTVNTDKEFTGQISDFWTLSPSLVNEFRAALDRRPTSYLTPDIGQGWMQKLGVQSDLSNTFPALQITSSFPAGLSGGTSYDIYNSQNTYVISDIATWVRGKHIVKIGGEFDFYAYVAAYNGSETFSFPGYATYNPALNKDNPNDPATAGLGYADFLFGQVHGWNASFGPSYQARSHSLQLFVQDDFKVRPNLTLNLGLRWQVEPAWTEAQGRVSSFEPNVVNPATGTPGAYVFGNSVLTDTLWNLFSPRFGFAYSPRSKWAIRGGYGIYRVQKGNNTAGAIENVGYARTNVAAGLQPDAIHDAFDWDNGVPGYKGTTAADRTLTYQNGGYAPWVLKHTPLGYLQQWQVSVQHELPHGFLLDVAYVANRGVHLNAPRNFNEVPLADLHFYTGAGVDMHPYLPWPIYPGGVVKDPHDAISMYNALQVSVKKQFGQGLSLIANYTQSKARDDSASSGNSGSGGAPVQNPLNLKAAYSISNTDVPSVINGGAVYQLPFGKGKQFLSHGRLLDEVAGGWQISAIWNLHAGTDFTPTNTVASTSGELGSPQLPIRVGDPWKAGPVAANPGCAAPAKVRTLTNYFNGCAYVVPPYGHLGQDNLRNSLRGPAWRSADMSVAKTFALFSVREQPVTFQLRMDAQDVFNHPNFGQPYTGTNQSYSGVIQNAQTNRTLQLSGKVTF